jgi:hypothetical protein
MSRKFALAALILVPSLIFATPEPRKQKENIVVEVASIKTDMHRTLPNVSYTYTDIIFAVVNEKHVVYACAERDKACPLLEAGSKIPAESDGDSIYISTTVPSEKKPLVIHYKFVSNGW